MAGVGMDNYSYILMKDTPGEKASGKIMVTFGGGSILRGELCSVIPPKEMQPRNYLKPGRNFRLKRDPNVTLYGGEDNINVAPLSRLDTELLGAIQRPCDRFAVFYEDGKLEWGGKLKKGDRVYVRMPGENSREPEWSLAVVQYVGEIESLPGRSFGVEIKDPRYRGLGSTNGFFQTLSYQYFQCEKDCGLFVSLDKLSSKPNPQGPQGAAQQQLLNQLKSSTLPPRGTNPPPQSTAHPGSTSSQGITSSVDSGLEKRHSQGTAPKGQGNVDPSDLDSVARQFGTTERQLKAEENRLWKEAEERQKRARQRKAKKTPGFKDPELEQLKGAIGESIDITHQRKLMEAYDQEKREQDRARVNPPLQPRQHLDNRRHIQAGGHVIQKQNSWQPLGTPRVYDTIPWEDRSSPSTRPHLAEHGKAGTVRGVRGDDHEQVHRQIEQNQGTGYQHGEQSNHDHVYANQPLPPGQYDNRQQGQQDGYGYPQSNFRQQEAPSGRGQRPPSNAHQKTPRLPVVACTGNATIPAHFDLQVGSTVQLATTDPNTPQRYGVIKWIGSVAQVQGHIAGIELEEYMEGCNDGTFPATGERIFECPPGHGLYFPLANLRPDERVGGATGGALCRLPQQTQAQQSVSHQQPNNVQSDALLEVERQEKARLLAELQEQLHHEKQEKQQALQELFTCKSELSSQKHKLSLCEGQLLSCRKEVAVRSINVWKVSPDKVETGIKIGFGGWGTVFKGKIQVAIKELHPAILSPQFIAKIKREMKLLAEVHHPNLVQFIGTVFDEEAERDRKPPLIITELLDMNLRQAYEQNQLQPGNRLSIFIDVARALDYLHQRYEPIIHRDVSAPNVLLQRQPNNRWKGKVSDLGSANFLQNAQTKGEGAILYSPPEVIPRAYNPSRKRITQTVKIDVYSYGVLLCEVITSRLPTEEDYGDMIEQVETEQPRMYELIIHCTKEDPTNRPIMAEVLVELEKMQQV